MKKNLSDYVAITKNAISDDLCDLVVQELEASPNWRPHTFTKFVDGQLMEFTSPKDPNQHDPTLPTVMPALMKIYWDAVYKYIDKDTGYKWFTSWQGFSPLKFIQYNPETEMRIHCDHIHSVFDGYKKGIPILTILGQFNNNFKGGELVLFEDEVIPFDKGDVIVFPSNFLFPHTIQNITEGVRYSAAAWVF